MSAQRIARLAAGDRDAARALFTLMADVFGERGAPLGNAYVDRLLAREDMWIIAALDGDAVVGGLTAHALPMTRSESTELLVYDLAVAPSHRRRGIGRLLLGEFRRLASEAGIDEVFVAVDEEDEVALDFYREAQGQPSNVTIFAWGEPRPESEPDDGA